MGATHFRFAIPQRQPGLDVVLRSVAVRLTTNRSSGFCSPSSDQHRMTRIASTAQITACQKVHSASHAANPSLVMKPDSENRYSFLRLLCHARRRSSGTLTQQRLQRHRTDPKNGAVVRSSRRNRFAATLSALARGLFRVVFIGLAPFHRFGSLG